MPPPRHRQGRGASGWVSVAIVAAAAASIATFLVFPGPVGESAIGLAMVAFLAGWGGVAVRVSRRRRGLERQAWNWFAGAALGTLIGSAVWLAVAALQGAVPANLAQSYLPTSLGGAALVSVGTLAIYGATFVGVLHLARLAGGRSRTQALVLDAAIGAGSLFFVVWSAGYRDIYDQSVLDPLTRALLIAYPVLDSALLAVAFMAFAAPAAGRPRAYGLLLAAFACMTLGDTTGAYVGLQDPTTGITISVVGETAALALLLVASLAILRGPAWQEPVAAPVPFWVQLLPVWPFSVAILAAIEAQREHGSLSQVQFWTAVLVLVLLVVRLVSALVQNQRLNKTLAASSAFKTHLLRFVSHEIANPLSPLVIELSNVRADQGPERRARSWTVIDRSVERLAHLSRDVRAMSLAEEGTIVRSTHAAELGPHVQAACRSAESVGTARGIEVRCRVETVAADIDPARFGQVLDNLLSNALKFTPDGGTIDVECLLEGDAAVVRVRDSGAGLGPEHAAALFQPFSRPHAKAPGLGLGLYLCKSIVEAMGGTIAATSPGLGQGSTFTVRLPAVPSPAVTPG